MGLIENKEHRVIVLTCLRHPVSKVLSRVQILDFLERVGVLHDQIK